MNRRITGILLMLVLLMFPLIEGVLGEATPSEATKAVTAVISNASDGTISGKVNIPDGSTVLVNLYKGSEFITAVLTTKDKPDFSFSGLADGDYLVQFFSVESKTVLFTMNAKVEKSKTASPIYAAANGGTNVISVKVTAASPLKIIVEVRSGETVKKSGTLPGPGELTFSDVEKGTYTVKCYYESDTGVSPCIISDVVVVDASSVIELKNIVPGEEKITISGTASPNATLLVSLYPGLYETVVKVGGDGKFSTILACAPGVYTSVSAQYSGNPGSKTVRSGSWVVTETSTVPQLNVDNIYDTDRTVAGVTRAGVIVLLETDDYAEYETADLNGFVKFSLPHVYMAGTKIKFTVFYGEEHKYSYSDFKTVASSGKYKELKYGSTGPEVYDLTSRLASLRYPVSATSYFDETVENAVRLFQSKNGLPVTGVADDKTQRSAYSSSAIPYDSHHYPTLVRGDRGPLVTELQNRLRKLGYYTIKVDGIFGSGTQRAVRNFQSRNGLASTGVADGTTQQLLYSSSAIPAGRPAPDHYTTLRRSNRYNSAVVPLQSRLNALGYGAGTVDGYFGSRTYRAVRNFQSRNGLNVTGVADVTTQEVLYSSSAIAAGSSKKNNSSASTGYRLLYWGCTGDSVRRLQQALVNLGYKQIKQVDGIYGKQTYDAVCAFQRANGLSVDGIAGKKTQNRLYGTNY